MQFFSCRTYFCLVEWPEFGPVERRFALHRSQIRFVRDRFGRKSVSVSDFSIFHNISNITGFPTRSTIDSTIVGFRKSTNYLSIFENRQAICRFSKIDNCVLSIFENRQFDGFSDTFSLKINNFWRRESFTAVQSLGLAHILALMSTMTASVAILTARFAFARLAHAHACASTAQKTLRFVQGNLFGRLSNANGIVGNLKIAQFVTSLKLSKIQCPTWALVRNSWPSVGSSWSRCKATFMMPETVPTRNAPSTQISLLWNSLHKMRHVTWSNFFQNNSDQISRSGSTTVDVRNGNSARIIHLQWDQTVCAVFQQTLGLFSLRCVDRGLLWLPSFDTFRLVWVQLTSMVERVSDRRQRLHNTWDP